MPLLIVVLSLLTFDFLYKYQVKDTVSSCKEAYTIEESVEPDQSNGKEKTDFNPFTPSQSLSEKGFKTFETIENEGINTKFITGIIL